MPMICASEMPSIRWRRGNSLLIARKVPAPGSEPIYITRSSRAARVWIMLMALLRMGRRSDLADGDADRVELVVGQFVLVMPIRIGLGGRQALALDRVADDRARLARHKRNLAQCGTQRVHVVAVQLLHGKAEAAPFVGERLKRQHIVGRA